MTRFFFVLTGTCKQQRCSVREELLEKGLIWGISVWTLWYVELLGLPLQPARATKTTMNSHIRNTQFLWGWSLIPTGPIEIPTNVFAEFYTKPAPRIQSQDW